MGRYFQEKSLRDLEGLFLNPGLFYFTSVLQLIKNQLSLWLIILLKVRTETTKNIFKQLSDNSIVPSY